MRNCDLLSFPLTCLQTFFSSGILDFSDEIQFGGWKTSWIGLQLFFAISLPIMILTLLIWAMYVYFQKDKDGFSTRGVANGALGDRALEEGRSLGIITST